MPHNTTTIIDQQFPAPHPSLNRSVGSENTTVVATKQDSLEVSMRTLLPVVVTATDGRSVQDDLTQAVEYLRSQAQAPKSQGILVTRHTTTTFSIAFSGDVPPGTTWERDLLKTPRTQETTTRR